MNMFAKAKEVKVTEEVKSEKKRNELEIGKSLDTYAAISGIITSLQTIQSDCDRAIKNTMMDKFVDDTFYHKKRADNFTGTSSLAEASCELRKRSSRSYLTDDEVKILKLSNISISEAVIQAEIPERFFFNPDLLTDSALAEKISAKLAEIPELAGKEVILKQAAREEVKKPTVSDSSFDDASKITDKDTLRHVLSILGTLAIKPKLKTQDLDELLTVIRQSGVKI